MGSLKAFWSLVTLLQLVTIISMQNQLTTNPVSDLYIAEAVASAAASGDAEKLRHLLMVALLGAPEPEVIPLCIIFCRGRPGDDFRTSQANEVGLKKNYLFCEQEKIALYTVSL